MATGGIGTGIWRSTAHQNNSEHLQPAPGRFTWLFSGIFASLSHHILLGTHGPQSLYEISRVTTTAREIHLAHSIPGCWLQETLRRKREANTGLCHENSSCYLAQFCSAEADQRQLFQEATCSWLSYFPRCCSGHMDLPGCMGWIMHEH